jgi:hypothetical protein
MLSNGKHIETNFTNESKLKDFVHGWKYAVKTAVKNPLSMLL